MENARELLAKPPGDFINYLKEHGIERFSFVVDPSAKKLSGSHAELQSIADFIADEMPDFDAHEGLFFQLSKTNDILQGVFVHNTVRGQAGGGVRFWHYNTLEEYLRDGLRLSRAMTQKIALAGLWWGGGKGVMVRNPSIQNGDSGIRAAVYRDFGSLCTRLRGCYVAAEDVGTTVTDMENIFTRSRYTTCIPKELGGSGNPSILTAKGVLCGMEAALDFLGSGTLKGKSVAVQGLGNVGGALVNFLFEKGIAKIIGHDIREAVIEEFRKIYPGDRLELKLVDRADNSIVECECDILSLNATGGVLTPDTIPLVKARIICGGANNQLEDAVRDDALLHERGITYIPDFVANRMGIVNCANEQYGVMDRDAYIERHLGREWAHSIHNTIKEMLKKSNDTGTPPGAIAMKMANELAAEPHPIFGHRGRQIIDALVAEEWHKK
jgi:glutamate dehydrogenase/leucine dehydrogenase